MRVGNFGRLLAQLSFVAVVAAVVFLVHGARASTVPTGFEDRPLVSGLDYPTAMAWAPDGRMFVAEHAGKVRTVSPAGQLLPTSLVDFSGHTNTVIDQGILGLAVDSDFASNHYLWILYVYEHNPSDSYGNKTARLSRVVVNDDNTVQNPESPETVVLGTVSTGPCPTPANNVDCIPSGWTHTIGTVISDPDGSLWVGAGDAGTPFNSYNEQSYSGKILHIDRNGQGLPGHPFCPTNNNLSDVCTKIYAKGFRNPFRFTLRPQGGLIVGDVGDETKDELNLVSAGKNYGWPCYEGSIRGPRYGSDSRCNAEYAKEGTPDADVGPVHDYPNPPNGAAIVAGPTYQGTSFPAEYKGNIFFGDYVKGFVKRAVLDAQGNITSVQDFASNWFGVDLQVAPYGDLVYADLNNGQIRAISYSPSNRTPVVDASASPTFGPLPLAVQFSSAGTSDPDGDPLIYEWDFGDGSTSNEPNPTHTYATDGKYIAKLTVNDGHGRSASDTVTVFAGNAPPEANITAPSNNSTYRGGQTLNLTGTATDPQDGQLTGSALQWNIILHHGSHTHPFGPFTGQTTSLVTASDHDSDSYYEIKLTATNSRGLSDTTTSIIKPQTINFTLDSNPAGAPLTYSGTTVVGPYTRTSAVGFKTQASAADHFFKENGASYKFVLWYDMGARAHEITIPATDQRLTAVYGEDKAFERTATASSSTAGNEPSKAVDGIDATSWTSSATNNQWWQVDLGGVRPVNTVWLNWGNNYASQYSISTSTDGVNFTAGATVSMSAPGFKSTAISSRNARYVRITGIQRATSGGISINDATVFGGGDSFVYEDKAAGKPASASTSKPGNEPAKANDNNSSTSWMSYWASNQWWQVDLGRVRAIDRVSLNWNKSAWCAQYNISTSVNGTNFTTASDVVIPNPSNWINTSFQVVSGRYVKITCTRLSTFVGVSFYDARIYGPAD